jgi:hypothetical protein
MPNAVKLIKALHTTIIAISGDNDTLSIVLDNGGIIQIAALSPLTRRGSARLHYELEFAPGTSQEN